MVAQPSKSLMTSIVGVIGSAVAGPIGAILGTFLGSITGNLLPGMEEFVRKVFTNLGAKGVEALSSKVNNRLSSTQKSYINHDLQTAFRDALLEAIYDIGGLDCFNDLPGNPRDVPLKIQFFKTTFGNTLLLNRSVLADQIKAMINDLASAVIDQKILPLDPPIGAESASVYSYLDSNTPSELAGAFFEQNISPFLNKYSATTTETPDFVNHLRVYLFDRTLLHLNECLKLRTPAWRAFNRIILESLQVELSNVSTSQSDILSRLDQILSPVNPQAVDVWSDTLAKLLSISTQTQISLDQGFDELTEKVVSQHQELVAEITQLNASAERIEKKVDRVLRYFSTGLSVTNAEQPTLPLLKPPAPGQPPYKGMQSFAEKDTEWFFGRDKIIAKIVTRLQSSRFLAVIGASGSGKSSIIRAGVIPVLKGNKHLPEVTYKPQNAQQWPVHVIVPTNHPLESLVASFYRDTHSLSEMKTVLNELHHDPKLFDLMSRKELSQHNSDKTLLVIDQFEELFTLCQEEEERIVFIDAVMSSPTTVLLIVLRADFYTNCSTYDQLREAISSNQEFLGPMCADELRLAIEEPARKGNWRFEPGLVDLIVKDVGDEPGGLPLLSHALLETWGRRSGRTMTLESYLESGGVKGAIAKTAEFVYNKRLDPSQRKVAQTIFLQLTNLGEGEQYSRRLVEVRNITSAINRESVENVIKTLIEARLITSDDGFIQVAHEALIREWPKLRNWLEENRESLHIHRRITEGALEWKRNHEDDDLVFRGLRLEEALAWLENENNFPDEIDREFILAGKNLKDRQLLEREAIQNNELAAAQKLAISETARAEEQTSAANKLKKRGVALRNALIGVMALALMVTALSLIAYSSMLQAQKDATESEKQSQISLSRELAARSISSSERDQDLSILLAVEAVKISQNPKIGEIPESQTALSQSLEKGNFDRSLHCHTDRVNLALFSPDSTKIASTSKDGSVCIWDSTGKLIDKLMFSSEEIYTALFNPESTALVIAGNSPVIRVWKSGSPVINLTGHSAPAGYAEFSPDGKLIVSASWDNTAKIWNVNGGLITTLIGHTKPLSLARFSLDGKLIVTASLDNTIRLWKTDGTFIKELTGHTALISSIFFSPVGNQFVSASWDGTAKIWSMEGTLLSTLVGHTRSINNALYNADGTLLVTSSYDNTARIWKSDGTSIITLRGHTGTVNTAMFSADGQRIITAGNDFTIRLWNLEGANLAILRGHSNWVSSALYNSDSSQIVSAGWDSTVRLWTTNALFDPILEGHTAPVTDVDFNTDGTLFLSSSSDSSIRLWAKDGTFLTSFTSEYGPINSAQFSPDGNSILISGTKNTAAIVSKAGKLITAFIGHTDMVDAALFSPNAKFVVTISKDNSAKIWRVDGGLIATLTDHQDRINAVSFHPNGESFSTVSTDGTARIWDLSGKLLKTIETVMPLSAVAFTPDCRSILLGESTGVILKYTLEGQFISRLNAHSDIVTSINWSNNGKYFVSTSVDGSITLWESGGNFITSFEGHSTWVTNTAFNPQSDRMISASWDGTVHLWNIFGDVDDMVSIGLKRIDKKLTDQECLHYLRQTHCP